MEISRSDNVQNPERVIASEYIVVEKSLGLKGEVTLEGAKNSVLVLMAAVLLPTGRSTLSNVPASEDVSQMIKLLEILGACVTFNVEKKELTVDTTTVNDYHVPLEVLRKMRASILVMGPLLKRFGKFNVARPGGCLLGPRPIDFYLRAFESMGATVTVKGDFYEVAAEQLQPARFVLEYPSVGATESMLMAAVLTPGTSEIINAALEPEVFDLIDALRKMGAHIELVCPGTIKVRGVAELQPIQHHVVADRLEAGTLLLAAAITGGSITIPDAPVAYMDVFLQKLIDMGHTVTTGADGVGVTLVATKHPKAVSFRTMPYPGFPTDLQPMMMVAQVLAQGESVIWETVFENRLVAARELQKMGAQITADATIAKIKGVDALYGAQVIGADIRATAALVLAGLVAERQTVITGVQYLVRGYVGLEKKLQKLGAKITLISSVK